MTKLIQTVRITDNANYTSLYEGQAYTLERLDNGYGRFTSLGGKFRVDVNWDNFPVEYEVITDAAPELKAQRDNTLAHAWTRFAQAAIASGAHYTNAIDIADVLTNTLKQRRNNF